MPPSTLHIITLAIIITTTIPLTYIALTMTVIHRPCAGTLMRCFGCLQAWRAAGRPAAPGQAAYDRLVPGIPIRRLIRTTHVNGKAVPVPAYHVTHNLMCYH